MKDKPTEISAADQKGIEGEATFLRAHYMFDAFKIWGNVPYLRETDTDLRKASENKAAVAAEILKDLDAAIATLPTTPRNGQVGRVTSWTAKAYKGKVQMYLGQYRRRAHDAAGCRGQRTVRARAELRSGLDGLQGSSRTERRPSSPIRLRRTTVSRTATTPTTASGSTSRTRAARSAAAASISRRRTWSTSSRPTRLVCRCRCRIRTAGTRTTRTYARRSTANMNVDPRMDWTAGRNGVPYKDWGLHDSTWIRNIPNGGTYSAKKNVHEKASGRAEQRGLGQHAAQLGQHPHPPLRRRPAAAGGSGSRGGRPYQCDMTREPGQNACSAKAQGPGTSAANIAVPINDPSITWAKYKVSPYPAFADQASARQAVRTERRLELAMEGQRFFDLKRWGIMQTTITAYLNGVGGGNEKTRRTISRAPSCRRRGTTTSRSRRCRSSCPRWTVARVPQNTGW